MLILLSPSKTQNFQTQSIPKGVLTSTPLFSSEINHLIKTLQGLTPDQISQLMSVSPKIADLNWNRFNSFEPNFTLENSKPSFLAFSGDVYKFIDSHNYTAKDWSFANTHCLTISGLYGLLRPLDLMQAYRLEMKTSLSPNLYEFWGDKLSNHINSLDNDFILNLASNEYSKAVINPNLKKKVYNLIFKDYKNNTYKIIAIYAKLARGAMANTIIKSKIQNIEEVKKLNIDGYKYSIDHSTASNLVFLRG